MDETGRLRADLKRLTDRVVQLERAEPRRVTVSLTNIAVGLTVVPISWGPGVTSGYTAVVTIIAAAASLPLLFAGVQSGSKDADTCNILVVNTGLAVIAAAGLDIVIVPGP